MPKISVITASYNAEKYIEQTIQSVLHQKGVDLEYIIIDGGSEDKTLEIIKKYESGINVWVSEPDSGISDAMNKGIAFASGEYLLFLHADDYFESDESLASACSHLVSDVGIFMFDIIYLTNHGGNRKRSGYWNFRMMFKGICHQGVLCKRELLLKYGGFDTSYKICMDYAFFMKVYLAEHRAMYIKSVLSVMRDTGVSSRKDWPSLYERFKEERRVHLSNAPGFAARLLYVVYWPTYLAYRRIMKIFN